MIMEYAQVSTRNEIGQRIAWSGLGVKLRRDYAARGVVAGELRPVTPCAKHPTEVSAGGNKTKNFRTPRLPYIRALGACDASSIPPSPAICLRVYGWYRHNVHVSNLNKMDKRMAKRDQMKKRARGRRTQ